MMIKQQARWLQAGGDDYITKPYSIEELMYKIEVYCKRSGVQTLTIANGEAVNRIGQYLFVPEIFPCCTMVMKCV